MTRWPEHGFRRSSAVTWQHFLLATVMFVFIFVITGGGMVLLTQLLQLDREWPEAFGWVPAWLRALLLGGPLAVGAYVGVLVTRPFLAAARSVSFVSVLISLTGGVTLLTVARQWLAGLEPEGHTWSLVDTLATAVFLGGMWTLCFGATLVRVGNNGVTRP